MTYQKAIEGAKKAAKKNNRSYVVIQLPKRRWWNKRRYDFYSVCGYNAYSTILYSTTKLLTITPTGTIAQ